MQIRLASPLQTDSIVDGDGLRMVVWTQGCKHACPGCHNAHTWNETGGAMYDIEDIKKQILENDYHDGITLSGGEPVLQVEEVTEIAKFAKEHKFNVWSYTGFTFEKLLVMSKIDKKYLEFLENVDVLIDGKFEIAKKTLDKPYRGSSNQRVIDVKKSLKAGRVCTMRKFDKSLSSEKLYTKKDYIFI